MRRNRVKRNEGECLLCHSVSVRVRFSEVDSMKIVWHGEYVRYFEDAREAFGRRFEGIGYMDIYQSGYTAPIVDLQLQFLRPLSIGDTATVEIRYIDSIAAKLCFEYTIRRDSDGELVARGSSIQVFVDANGELLLTVPPFLAQWKEKWLKK